MKQHGGAEVAGAIDTENRRGFERGRIVCGSGVRMMVLDDDDFAFGKARAQLQVGGTFESGRERPRHRDTVNVIDGAAGDLHCNGERFFGECSRPVLARDFGLLDGRGNVAIRQYTAGGIAQQAA